MATSATREWDSLKLDTSKKGIINLRGFNFLSAFVTPEQIDSLEDFEIRDDDVFLVTYPKSGTMFAQQVLSLIYHEGHRNGTENINTIDRVPWIEYDLRVHDHKKRPSPRLFASHLPYHLLPRDFRNRRGKVIYIIRNPKDVMTSFYHHEKKLPSLTPSPNFSHFMERYLKGEVFGGCWFEHIRGWYSQKENVDFLLLSYEEMVKDLRTVVLKICQFGGQRLNDQEVDSVVEQATFKNMKSDPRANYVSMPKEVLDSKQGGVLRKGTIGDWKNIMTVAQSERFDKIFQEKMKDLPFKFIWDINEDM
ncbi:amine sulfotransferase-like [Lissotriton helveticus]